MTAVSFELEGDTCFGQKLEDFPTMPYAEWLATAECYIRNTCSYDLSRKRERFLAREFITPGLIRTGLLAARDAPGSAAIGQLPGNEERGGVRLDRVRLHCAV